MVGAGNPQGAEALHTLVTDQDILKRVVKRVAHVELTGDVGRRNDDGVGRSVTLGVRRKIAFFAPFLVKSVFQLRRSISFSKFVFHGCNSFQIHVLGRYPPVSRGLDTRVVSPRYHS